MASIFNQRSLRIPYSEAIPTPEDLRDLLNSLAVVRNENTDISVNADGSRDHLTLSSAMSVASLYRVEPGKTVTITIYGDYDSTNERLFHVGPHVIIKADEVPQHITKADANMTAKTGDEATDDANLAADKARILAMIEARFKVKLRYTNGTAVLLKNGSIGRLQGIAFIGEAGNSAAPIICGHLDGTPGNGASLGLRHTAWIGFSKDIGTGYGGCIKSTDDSMFVGFSEGTNIQIQYTGMVFAKGATVVGAKLFNAFCKRGGTAYFSGTLGGLRTFMSHSKFTNVLVGGSGVCHVDDADLGESGGVILYAYKGGFISANDSEIDGGNIFGGIGQVEGADLGITGEGIRNDGGNIQAQRAVIKNIAHFGLRNISGDTDLSETVFEGCANFNINVQGGNVFLTPLAIGRTIMKSDNGGIFQSGGTITGAVQFEKFEYDPNDSEGPAFIRTWFRFDGGTARLHMNIVDGANISTGNIYTLKDVFGSVRILTSSIGGVPLAANDIVVRDRDNTSVAPDTSNGDLNYTVGNDFEMIVAT